MQLINELVAEVESQCNNFNAYYYFDEYNYYQNEAGHTTLSELDLISSQIRFLTAFMKSQVRFILEQLAKLLQVDVEDFGDLG